MTFFPTSPRRLAPFYNLACIGIADLSTFDQCATSTRLAMLVGAMILGCPLVIATQLRPAIAGLGTHQQLGLPPCTVRVLWGVRCPACGMTTSWAHLVRGQLVQSIQSNAGGTAFGLITLAAATTMVGHAVIAQVPSRRWAMVLVYAVSTAFVITLVDWSWRLANGG